MTDDDKILLIRLEERINNLQKKLDDVIRILEKQGQEMKDEFVTQKEFQPVRNAMYGAIGLILTAFLGAVITLVFGAPIK